MNVKLEKFVLLGYSDIAAVGCRALLGVDMQYHTDAEKLNLQIPNHDHTGFLDLGLVTCKGKTEYDNAFSPLQIVNIPSKSVSLIILNCKPSMDISHEVINWIMDTLVVNHVESLQILTALSIADMESGDIYEISLFQEKSKDFPDPPKGAKTSDDIFNKLIQFTYVVKIPTSCFVVSGRKARQGVTSRDELGTIQVLQTLAEELTSVKFNILTSRELVCSEHVETVMSEVKSMYL